MSFLVCFFCLLMACTSFAEIIELAPKPNVQAMPIGHGKNVILEVVDARQSDLTAHYAGAQINPKQNVVQIFNDAISKGLKLNGFSVINNSNSIKNANLLSVKILLINFKSASSYTAANTQTEVAISVTAKNSSGIYTRTYHSNSFSDTYLIATRIEPSEQVNTVVSNILSDLLNDRGLMQFLAG